MAMNGNANDAWSRSDGDSYSLESENSSQSDSDSLENDSSRSITQSLDTEQKYPPSPGPTGAAVRRRMAPTTGGSRSSFTTGGEPDQEEEHSGGRKSHHGHRDGKKGRKSNKCSRLMKFCRRHHSTFIKYWPTLFMAACFMFWLVVQTGNVYEAVAQSTHQKRRPPGSIGRRNPNMKGDNSDLLRQPQPLDRGLAGGFFSDAWDGFVDLVALPGKLFRDVSRGEALPPGCARSPWQALNLPNCNDMHETNLLEVFSSESEQTGYVGSGYWRHVWLVANRGGDGDASRTVLKMMKQAHKVEHRNFERHRRDALAMERTTASPYIVDIYSFCGNSVLTEYVGSDLDKLLYGKGSSNQISGKPPLEKLRLAWEVAKSVADLHEVPGGPIVQADITAKQFLVDDHGHIKLNDFNRCRFMGHKKDTKEKCTFRIPSAPGRNRSPEEYEDEELTEQLDTYSTAHVLYGILTGKRPWDDLPASQVKRAAKHGVKPSIDEKYREPGTPEALLASLIERAYEHDPETRIRASEMVAEIENFSQASQSAKVKHNTTLFPGGSMKKLQMRTKAKLG